MGFVGRHTKEERNSGRLGFDNGETRQMKDRDGAMTSDWLQRRGDAIGIDGGWHLVKDKDDQRRLDKEERLARRRK